MVVDSFDDLGDTRRKSPRISTDVVIRLIPTSSEFRIMVKAVLDDDVRLEGLLTDVSKVLLGEKSRDFYIE